MPRRNRVDPFGDLHAAEGRGLFTGNRGCLVDENRNLARHHVGSLWITCEPIYRDWSHPLDEPHTWTPLFFLDDAVALAAGHRPCGLCRRADYLSYQRAVATSTRSERTENVPKASELNAMLANERLRRGRGLERRDDRILWSALIDDLPAGAVILEASSRAPLLVTADSIQDFTFGGWGPPTERPQGITVDVLTPPTSVKALDHGFQPRLHRSAG